MSLHKAYKVTVITEKLISEPVCEIISESGATGYTLVAAGGKGSQSLHATSSKASVVEDFSNVRIECIVGKKSIAEEIIEKVAERFFKKYPGITFLEEVEVKDLSKF